jgi:hypothetical protein
VARLVRARAASQVRGDPVGRVHLDEAQEIQESPLAQDGQQERCLREVLELQEREKRTVTLETPRALPARRRKAPAGQGSAPPMPVPGACYSRA